MLRHPEEHIRFAQCKLRDEGSQEILRRGFASPQNDGK